MCADYGPDSVLLVGGAEFLVRGAGRVAVRFGLSPIVVGLTVVAFGTSAPELVVSLVSAAKGKSMIALGNVVGSNICNIALVLGLAAFLQPITCARSVIKRGDADGALESSAHVVSGTWTTQRIEHLYLEPEAALVELLRGKSIRSRTLEEFWALKDVSFDIAQGDVVGALGELQGALEAAHGDLARRFHAVLVEYFRVDDMCGGAPTLAVARQHERIAKAVAARDTAAAVLLLTRHLRPLLGDSK